ncbi:MAG: NUDIX domain-containing protein [Lacibacter sp.]
MQIHTVGLLVIRKRKLLLAFSNNKQCYYLPGGKIDNTETPETALCREIAEELNTNLTPGDFTYYTHISAKAYGEADGLIMEQECYLLTTEINATPSAEIGSLGYFSLEDYLEQPVTAPGAVMILEKLKADHLID